MPHTQDTHWHGKRVVVTGAAHGIGRSIAEQFAQAGAQVVVWDNDAQALAQLQAHYAQCAPSQGPVPTVQLAPVDVSQATAVQRAAQALEQACGPCDVLVCNAGVLLRSALEEAQSTALWQRTMDVNLSGCFYCAHAFAAQLRSTRGCIVNIASIHAFVAVRNSVAYTASKGGIKQLTQALALELGEAGVRVNAVAPGITDTRMTQATHSDPEALHRFLRRVPLQRSGTPQDIAHAVQFLASAQASYITGVTLPVDGGYCAT